MELSIFGLAKIFECSMASSPNKAHWYGYGLAVAALYTDFFLLPLWSLNKTSIGGSLP